MKNHQADAALLRPRPTRSHNHHGNSGRDEHGYLTYEEALPAVTHWRGELKAGTYHVKAIVQTDPVEKVAVVTFIRATGPAPQPPAYSLEQIDADLEFFMEELKHKRIKVKLEEWGVHDSPDDILQLTRYTQ